MGKLQRDNGKRKAEIEQLAAEQRRDNVRRTVRRRELALLDVDKPAGEPPPPRVNRGDAPKDYDPELGLILEDRVPSPEPSAEDAARFAELATQVIGYLGHASRWRGAMPLAAPDPWPPDAKIEPLVWRARRELEALHRALSRPKVSPRRSWTTSQPA
jgi:hypothetical protein